MQTNSEEVLFSCSITQEPGTKQLGAHHMPLSLPKLFKIANSIHTNPSLPTHSQGNHNKNLCPTFSPCFFYVLLVYMLAPSPLSHTGRLFFYLLIDLDTDKKDLIRSMGGA